MSDQTTPIQEQDVSELNKKLAQLFPETAIPVTQDFKLEEFMETLFYKADPDNQVVQWYQQGNGVLFSTCAKDAMYRLGELLRRAAVPYLLYHNETRVILCIRDKDGDKYNEVCGRMLQERLVPPCIYEKDRFMEVAAQHSATHQVVRLMKVTKAQMDYFCREMVRRGYSFQFGLRQVDASYFELDFMADDFLADLFEGSNSLLECLAYSLQYSCGTDNLKKKNLVLHGHDDRVLWGMIRDIYQEAVSQGTTVYIVDPSMPDISIKINETTCSYLVAKRVDGRRVWMTLTEVDRADRKQAALFLATLMFPMSHREAFRSQKEMNLYLEQKDALYKNMLWPDLLNGLISDIIAEVYKQFTLNNRGEDWFSMVDTIPDKIRAFAQDLSALAEGLEKKEVPAGYSEAFVNQLESNLETYGGNYVWMRDLAKQLMNMSENIRFAEV